MVAIQRARGPSMTMETIPNLIHRPETGRCLWHSLTFSNRDTQEKPCHAMSKASVTPGEPWELGRLWFHLEEPTLLPGNLGEKQGQRTGQPRLLARV